MTDWPADARAFSRPTSKAREKRPGDEVELIFTCVYTHVNFTRVNEIEATYEVFLLNVKYSKIQLLVLRAIFHTLFLFYLRT